MIGSDARLASTGATVLIVALGSGVAAAAVISRGHVDSSGVIHGCWSNHAIRGSRVFVMQDAGTSCPGEPPLSRGTRKVPRVRRVGQDQQARQRSGRPGWT